MKYVVLVFLVTAGNCTGETLTVVTYNFQNWRAGQPWSTRVGLLASTILELAPDIVGLQVCLCICVYG